MTAQITESFQWATKELLAVPSDRNIVKIKGIAVKAGEISRNQRLYAGETLEKGASSFIDAPVTVNHSDYNAKHNQVGKVNWMAFDKDGNMEYIAEVWNPAMVEELRAYAKNPKSSKIREVSLQADYLFDECPVCKQRFTSNTLFQNHMSEVEFKPMSAAPAQMKGRALSLVLAPQVPGVPSATLEVCEVLNGFSRLLETVTKTIQEEQNYMSKINASFSPRHSIAVAPTAKLQVIEEEAPEKPAAPADIKNCPSCNQILNDKGECTNKECHPPAAKEEAPKPKKPLESPAPAANEEPEVKEQVKTPKVTAEAAAAQPKTTVIKEALTLPPLATPKFPEIKYSVSEIEAGTASRSISEQKQLLETLQGICMQINRVQEYLSSPFTVTSDDLTWQTQIGALTDSTNKALETLTIAVNGVPIYNDKSLRETFEAKIKAIPTYDDSPLKTEVKTLSETVNTQFTKLTEQETAFKQLKEICTNQAGQITQLTKDNEKTTAEIKQLTETFSETKEDFESILAVADRNIEENKKTLETRILEMQKTNESQATQLKEAKEIAEKAKTLAENEKEHRVSNFKGHNTQLKETKNNDPINHDPLNEKETT